MSPRREQLLDLAEALLEREGLEQFGITRLAREAGIRPPSLYKHFSGTAELEHALIARLLRRLAAALEGTEGRQLEAFAVAYRRLALESPQLYRLQAGRPLDRELLEQLDPGCEAAAMQALLTHFGEEEGDHHRARLAWAAAHGLVSLELAGRFPPSADLREAWDLLTELFS